MAWVEETKDRQNIVSVELAICQLNDVELTFYINLSLQSVGHGKIVELF